MHVLAAALCLLGPHSGPNKSTLRFQRLLPGSYSAAAGNGGVNASIQYELDRPDNFGLKRGW